MHLVLVEDVARRRRAREPTNLHGVGRLIVIFHTGSISQWNREIIEADSDIHGQLGINLPLVAGVTSEILRVRIVIVRPLEDLAGVLGKAEQERSKGIVLVGGRSLAGSVGDGGTKLRSLFGEMEVAGAADVAAAGRL